MAAPPHASLWLVFDCLQHKLTLKSKAQFRLLPDMLVIIGGQIGDGLGEGRCVLQLAPAHPTAGAPALCSTPHLAPTLLLLSAKLLQRS